MHPNAAHWSMFPLRITTKIRKVIISHHPNTHWSTLKPINAFDRSPPHWNTEDLPQPLLLKTFFLSPSRHTKTAECRSISHHRHTLPCDLPWTPLPVIINIVCRAVGNLIMTGKQLKHIALLLFPDMCEEVNCKKTRNRSWGEIQVNKSVHAARPFYRTGNV